MDDKFKFRFDVLDSKIEEISEVSKELMTLNKSQIEKLHEHDIRFERYNNLLDKHIEGVIQNRTGISDVKEELDEHITQSADQYNELKVEIQPVKNKKIALSYIKKTIVGLGAMAAAIWAILKLIGKA